MTREGVGDGILKPSSQAALKRRRTCVGYLASFKWQTTPGGNAVNPKQRLDAPRPPCQDPEPRNHPGHSNT